MSTSYPPVDVARTKPGDQRKRDLLDAAESLVLERGVDGLTVDEVVGGAGVAKGTFYLHFATKAELIRALRHRYLERFVARQRAAVRDGADDGAARVERWVVTGVLEYLDEVRLHDVLFHHGTRDEDTTTNLAIVELHRLLDEVEAPVPDREATAVLLYHVMHGAADQVAHDPGQRERLLAEVSRVCRAVLAVPRGS